MMLVVSSHDYCGKEPLAVLDQSTFCVLWPPARCIVDSCYSIDSSCFYRVIVFLFPNIGLREAVMRGTAVGCQGELLWLWLRGLVLDAMRCSGVDVVEECS